MRDRKTWVIVGAGYTGTRLARARAAAGDEVTVTRRRSQDASAVAAAIGGGVRGIALDLCCPGQVAELPIDPGAAVVIASPPSAPGAKGECALVRASAAAGGARVVYLSSTGVYPVSPDGAWMDEDTPAAPTSERGRIRLATEQAVERAASAAGVEVVVLRAAGIYGPGRGVPARMLAGTHRIVGAGDTWVCRVHVVDLVQAIVAAACAPSLPRVVYNVVDDVPAWSQEVAGAMAERLGIALPPRVAISDVKADVATMLTANRRVSNRRLKDELGVALRYPSWREGMAASL